MARQADTDERDSVHGVNPGTELGRYTVNARIDTIPGGERWSARDTTLERDVTLLVMPADQLPTDAALDAARRAAGVEAAQLVRILDVGTEGEHSYIAEEGVGDAETFADAIDTDGLPAEEVRRITGEVATGIEAARARGLHHLALSPDTVLLTHDGRVKVRGLATSAALAGTETEGEDADRDDASGVVALAYAGLTATWPLSGDTSLPAAPRDGGSVPPPSRVSVGVPGDLDTICRETLNEDAGPDSPGDYAAQIAPWSRIPLTSARPTPSGTADSSTGTAAPTKGAAAAGATTAAAAGAAGGAAARSAGSPTADAPQRPEDDNATREINLHPEDEPTRTIDTRQVRRQDRAGAEEDARHGDSQSRAKAAAAAAAAAGAVGSGAKVIGGQLGKASKSANARSKEAYKDARARREAIREDRSRRTSLGAAPISAELEAPAPLLPAEAGAPPSRSQSNLVVLLMAALVTLACVGGIFGSAQIGSNTNLAKIFGGDETTAAQTRTPDSQTASGGGSSSSSDEENDEPYQILNAAGFDPEPGDGAEHNAEVQRVYDGDDDTEWTTEGYFDPEFGGVKDGVGITVDLGQTQEVNAVTLELPTTADATVYAGDEPTREGSEIGSTEGKDGEVELTADEPTEAQYVTVWFTSLTESEDDGRYRAALGEITVR